MVKYITLLIVFSVLLVPFRSTYAQMGMMDQLDNQEIQEKEEIHGEGLDDVLSDILTAQGTKTLNGLDCKKVDDFQLERLGEAWMSVMHPDPEIHERMDEMMGGEGSERLKTAHINMGARYLGCTQTLNERGWIGLMGTMSGGMMGSWRGYGGGIFGLHWFLWLITWILLNALLIVVIRYFWNKGGKKK